MLTHTQIHDILKAAGFTYAAGKTDYRGSVYRAVIAVLAHVKKDIIEDSSLRILADRLAESCSPDDPRLGVAYAIARYLQLDWPALAQEPEPMRFSHTTGRGGIAIMEPDMRGDYVKWSDVQSLLARSVLQPPTEPMLPEFYVECEVYVAGGGVVSVFQRRADDVPLLVHQEQLPIINLGRVWALPPHPYADLADGYYWLSSPDEPTASLVRVYTYNGVKSVGFGVWDGAACMPMKDVRESSTFRPAILTPQEGGARC